MEASIKTTSLPPHKGIIHLQELGPTLFYNCVMRKYTMMDMSRIVVEIWWVYNWDWMAYYNQPYCIPWLITNQFMGTYMNIIGYMIYNNQQLCWF
jgi:hypothetical protein